MIYNVDLYENDDQDEEDLDQEASNDFIDVEKDKSEEGQKRLKEEQIKDLIGDRPLRPPTTTIRISGESKRIIDRMRGKIASNMGIMINVDTIVLNALIDFDHKVSQIFGEISFQNEDPIGHICNVFSIMGLSSDSNSYVENQHEWLWTLLESSDCINEMMAKPKDTKP